MGSTTSPHILRKLGNNEHFSSSRHHLGIYRCVTVSCRYLHPPASLPLGTSVTPSFYAALAAVVKDQPMLRVGITGDDTNDAHFTHIPQIDLRNHVSVIAVPCQSVQEYEAKVAEHQGWEHNQLFKELTVRPPWRITILRPSSDNEDVLSQLNDQEDVFFAFHHALMDGTSGRKFHEMLLSTPAFQGKEELPAEPAPVLSFPEPPSSIPEAQDDVVNFTLSVRYTLGVLWDEFGPSFLKAPKQPIWSAIPIDLSLPYNTRVKTVDISPESLSTVLAACRSHSVTLTALLHSFALASLSARLPSPTEAPAFAAATPISLRPFTTASAMNPDYVSSLRCLVAACTHHFSPEAVSALRAPGADTTALIWENAGRVKAELAAKLATMPKDDIMAMLKYISDWFDFWRGRDGKKRSDSWEISNIGVLNNPASDGNGNGNGADVPRATRLLFTNGAMAAGPPLSINVASVAGSKLTLGLSWPDAVVEDELMDHLAQDLSAYIAKFHETGSSFV
ncbi:alcohol acetyltransferase [Trichoderma arundinaceum]|uniref:Alcohol acetyltransferase n=1 Tax=Trichoderma arundinaceum TaxID=490622 RepID=A0A395NK72_TRIAR|nr:alcohol acetyltransferase [Trichoderma arundinaceum]